MSTQYVFMHNIMKTCLYSFDPLKSTFIQQNWGLQGYTLIFLFLLQNTDCEYLLELPHWHSSNKYPQSMYWAEIWKLPELFIWTFSFFGGKILNTYIQIGVF